MLENIIKAYHGFCIRKQHSLDIGLERNGICFTYVSLYYDKSTNRFKLKSLKKGYQLEVGSFEYDFLLHIKQEVSKINYQLHSTNYKSLL